MHNREQRHNSLKQRRQKQDRHRSPDSQPKNLKLRTNSRDKIGRIGGVILDDWLTDLLSGVPALSGRAIVIGFADSPTAYHGQLHSRKPEKGHPVYAASFIRRRRIVLDRELCKTPDLMRLILVHELYHFVWARSSNAIRKSYESLLLSEMAGGARREMGESAEIARSAVAFDIHRRSAVWKNYVCESFCDTAAWIYAGVNRHKWFRLAGRWQRERRTWFLRQSLFKC